MSTLESEASSPKTPPLRLQELANNHPRLRPLIAMNPATYPALVQWLGELNDPAVNVALSQRAATQGAAEAPRRVSVMGRTAEPPASNSPALSTPEEARGPIPSPQGSPEPNSRVGSGPVQAGPTPVGTHWTPVEAGSPLPAYAGTASVPVPEKSQTQWKTILLVAAGLLLLFVVGFFGVRALTSGSSQEAAPASAEQSEPESSDEGPQSEPVEQSSAPVETPTEPVVLFPAPESALQLESFVSPSGNIACRLGEEDVTCSINSYSFADDAVASCGAGPATFIANATRSQVDCALPPISDNGATTLAYEDYATRGHTACRSTENGVSCWSTLSGSGFALSRGGYMIALDAPIDPATFPWS